MKNTKIKNKKSHFSLFRFIVCSRQFPSTEVHYEAKEKRKLFFWEGVRWLFNFKTQNKWMIIQ